MRISAASLAAQGGITKRQRAARRRYQNLPDEVRRAYDDHSDDLVGNADLDAHYAAIRLQRHGAAAAAAFKAHMSKRIARDEFTSYVMKQKTYAKFARRTVDWLRRGHPPDVVLIIAAGNGGRDGGRGIGAKGAPKPNIGMFCDALRQQPNVIVIDVVEIYTSKQCACKECREAEVPGDSQELRVRVLPPPNPDRKKLARRNAKRLKRRRKAKERQRAQRIATQTASRGGKIPQKAKLSVRKGLDVADRVRGFKPVDAAVAAAAAAAAAASKSSKSSKKKTPGNRTTTRNVKVCPNNHGWVRHRDSSASSLALIAAEHGMSHEGQPPPFQKRRLPGMRAKHGRYVGFG